jgi:hypothetical protein
VVRTINFVVEEEGHTDTSLEDNKTAVEGGPMYSTASASLDAQTTSTCVAGHATIPTERPTDEDDDLLALKRAAYGGYDLVGASIARMPDQQAEATVVEYDVHPSDMTDVHAELIGQDYSAPLESTSSAAATPQHSYYYATFEESAPLGTAAAHSKYYSEAASIETSPPVAAASASAVHDEYYSAVIEPSCVTSTTQEALEAYFGEIPPVAAAAAAAAPNTQDAYHVVESSTDEEATEATVIESGPIIEKTTVEAEPWSSSLTEEARVLEEDTVTVADLDRKPPAVDSVQAWVSAEEHGSDGVAVADEEAEVVGITEEVHPSELCENVARAELIGSDFNCAVAVQTGGNVVEDGVNEAVPTEEGSQHIVDSLVHAQAATGEQQEVTATLVEEAFDEGQISTTIAQESYEGSQDIVDPVVHAQAATGEQHEATATLVEESFDERQGLTTIAQESYNESGSSISTAPTPVTTILEENYDNGYVSFLKEPRVQVTAESRAVSAPAVMCSINPFDDDPRDSPAMSRDGLAALDAVVEQDWMHSPSFGGNIPFAIPFAIPPPDSSETDADTGDPTIPRPSSPVITTSSTSNRSDASNSQRTGLQTVSLDFASPHRILVDSLD